jgi:hypothetical protein
MAAAKERPEERPMVIAAVVEALQLRMHAEILSDEKLETMLGADRAALSSHALVNVRVGWNKVPDLDVRATWTWSQVTPVEPSLFALAAMTGERRELTAAEKLVDLGRASVLAVSCGLSVGTICPAQSMGQSNASKLAPTEATAPKAARLARALDHKGFVVVPSEKADDPVELTVDVEVKALGCELQPCEELRLVARLEIAPSPLPLSARFAATFAAGDRVFARDEVAAPR